jgi:DNA-binding HxlR family transcriptional regulator
MSISDQLAKFLREGHGWIASGDLQRMEWLDKRGNLATPSNISRRLRELAAEGVLEVQIRHGHAHYRLAQKELTLFNV